jgi:hypothetical protein
MGCYESFTADIICPYCNYKWNDNDIQSKDFECVLDHLKQGEDTRKFEPSYIIHADSHWHFGDHEKLKTLEEAIEFQKQNPNDYHLIINHFKGLPTSWSIFKFLGHRPTTFYGIKDREFNCYSVCPKCKKWLDMIGIIKDYIFIGIRNKVCSCEFPTTSVVGCICKNCNGVYT